jgi:hypothetical protein
MAVKTLLIVGSAVLLALVFLTAQIESDRKAAG